MNHTGFGLDMTQVVIPFAAASIVVQGCRRVQQQQSSGQDWSFGSCLAERLTEERTL